jgi:two-component system nitrogen regulation sensor histidine kinase GlnL
MLNIIQNACDATKNVTLPKIIIRIRSARQFTIGAQRHKIVLKIEIIDNGVGIAPEMIERIFFPMITDKPSGSGLGLSIAQTVLTQHHGSVQVESKPGKTKFLIHLPFKQSRMFKSVVAS